MTKPAPRADAAQLQTLRREGVQLAQAGRFAEAVAPLETAARLDPTHSATLNNLGLVLKELGRRAEAEQVLRQALAAAPGSFDVANSLGLVLMELGRLTEAESVFRAGLALAPDHADLLNNASVLLKRLGRQLEGEPLLRRGLVTAPNDPGLLVNLGDLLVTSGRAAEAVPLLERAVQLAPRSPEARNNLALALKELGREGEATPHLEAALALNPRYLPAVHNLGNNLVAIGRVKEGVARFLEVLDRDPHNMAALYALSTITDYTLDDAAVAMIDGLLAQPTVTGEARQLLHMAAAAARDRRGEHDPAIRHAITSGGLRRALDRRAGRGFVRDQHARLMDALIAAFPGVGAAVSSGLGSDVPVFVVGMPRSGTTLVEQILASHPQVHGAGETDAIAQAAMTLGGGRIDGDDAAAYPRVMPRLTPAQLAAAAEQVLASYRASAATARPATAPADWPARIIDKTTINLLHVGLIHALFPRAKIIHTLRDERDTAVSCLFHNFTGAALNFTNDLGYLGLVLRGKERLMAHWHATLPGVILDVPYEAVVADVEGWARRMLDHVGLLWSDRCLEFHALERRVKTASNLQVRKPIYSSSVARWKRYEQHLGPLLDALAGQEIAEPTVPAGLDPAPTAAGNTARPQATLMQQGIAAHAAGRFAEAVKTFRQAVAAAPGDPRARMNLGVALKEAGAIAEAEAAYRQALAIAPRFPAAFNNLGILLADTGRDPEAVACFEEALRLDPGFADARHNRGAALANMHRHAEALEDFRIALAAQPNDAEFHNSLGASLAVTGDTAGALAAYERALALDPAHAWAHFNRSQAWLLRGEFRRGFAEWEWRKKLRAADRRQWDSPEWQGQPLPTGTLLVHAEQGLGDTLQFIRFARTIRPRVQRLVVECQAALVPLLARCEYVDEFVAKGTPLPPHDAHASLLSLPHVLGLDADGLTDGGPYLSADPQLVARWGEFLERLPGRKIGIAWQGNPKYRRDAFRSLPLAAFAPLAAVPGVTLVSLQQGAGQGWLADPATRPAFPIVDPGPEVDTTAGGFMDTAALMQGLDLVVTSDTSIPHLAGALGVPVWLAVAANPDFRWMDSGDRSPWYPSMRLFRQPRPGDWESVFTAIAASL
ncbi:MAG: tetratricopeptide repeat protein [Planctomycetaceae bacterium]